MFAFQGHATYAVTSSRENHEAVYLDGVDHHVYTYIRIHISLTLYREPPAFSCSLLTANPMPWQLFCDFSYNLGFSLSRLSRLLLLTALFIRKQASPASCGAASSESTPQIWGLRTPEIALLMYSSVEHVVFQLLCLIAIAVS
ncbi:hypothetical protein WN55_05784 [Dufourea novaeangliae]|uniref:Uncharacterized protein n=1 Tax=Dufourea novaeangliae TaxID=178035 RepID=A0A154P012_DUFNO|nr:hypothetical protein WN55_05784 [Dufourea novaeangliae]